MGIKHQETLVHWNYFLSIEEDLYKLNRYVAFSEDNYDTYSLEIARILMAAGAEVDVVLKQLCLAIDPESKANGIKKYFTVIKDNFKKFVVTMPSRGLELTPWISWDEDNPPEWWTANNKVKHHRHSHFSQASLKNCIDAVAALYVVILHWYSSQANNGKLLQHPRLFNVADEHFGGNVLGRHGHYFKYKIPELNKSQEKSSASADTFNKAIKA